ncbi:MAG TPA: hypothetical protein VI112_01765 [Bacteroidia bacterium]
MKRTFLFLPAFLFLLLGSFVPAGKGPVKQVCPNSIDITDGRVSIDGKTLDDLSIRSFQEILGEPTKISKLANTIYTYSNCGICIYETPGTGMLNEMQVHFRHEKQDYAPKKNFKGVFTLQGKVISNGENYDNIRSAFPEYKFDRDETYPEGSKDGIYVLLDKPDKKPGVGCVSFGPKKKEE